VGQREVEGQSEVERQSGAEWEWIRRDREVSARESWSRDGNGRERKGFGGRTKRRDSRKGEGRWEVKEGC
jgi:hypothetical protein